MQDTKFEPSNSTTALQTEFKFNSNLEASLILNNSYCMEFMNSISGVNDNYLLMYLYLGLWVLSTSGLLFVALTIFFNKNLQAHP